MDGQLQTVESQMKSASFEGVVDEDVVQMLNGWLQQNEGRRVCISVQFTE
jgi:hypothetical protein